MFHLAREMIRDQINDPIHKDISAAVFDIYRDIDNKEYTDNAAMLRKSPFAKELLTLIKKRFGLTVEYSSVLSGIYGAAIVPAMSDTINSSKLENGFTLSKMLKGFNPGTYLKEVNRILKSREEDYKKISEKTGYVDIKRARVGGYLSEVRHFLLINFFGLKAAGVTPEEMSAIILHEVGHAFTGLESHHKLNSTNATIFDIIGDINNNKQDVAAYKFKKKFTKSDIDEAALGKNEHIGDFYYALANEYMAEVDSQILNKKYDETTFENMADSFATRLGAGADLATALSKLMHLNKTNYYATFALTVISEVVFAAIIFSLLSPAPAIGLIFAVTVFNTVFSNHVVMTYDFPVDRYTRVRGNIVNGLKNTVLSDSDALLRLNQIQVIDDVITNTHYMEDTYSYLAKYFTPTGRSNRYYINLQKTTESLLNNELFVARWKLKVA